MLRLLLFLLLSLLLHTAGWLLYGREQAPQLNAANATVAPQVLRLPAVMQQPAPVPQRPPEATPLRQIAKARSVSVPPAVVPTPSAKPRHKALPVEAPRALARGLKATEEPAVEPALARATPVKPVAMGPAAEVLSTKPSYREPPRQPRYPSQARRRNQQGMVLVEVRLDARGQQRSVQVLRSSGVSSLDRAALKAVAQWRFHPEKRGGQAVPSRVQIPIQFALTANR